MESLSAGIDCRGLRHRTVPFGRDSLYKPFVRGKAEAFLVDGISGCVYARYH